MEEFIKDIKVCVGDGYDHCLEGGGSWVYYRISKNKQA